LLASDKSSGGAVRLLSFVQPRRHAAMSLAARLLIAVAAGLSAAMMFLWASQAEADAALVSWLIGTFCLAVALACFLRGRAAQVLGGLIALGVLAAGVAYLASMLMHGPLVGSGRGGTSILQAALFLGVFGWPAALYLRNTRFGFAKPRGPLSEQLSIAFDDERVQLQTPDGNDERWNRRFAWPDIVRVCFRDAGAGHSDLLFIELRDAPDALVIPLEASGGAAFLGALTARGLFPEAVWRRALAETGGRTWCWPPHEEAPSH
jgi:hypothetical protein